MRLWLLLLLLLLDLLWDGREQSGDSGWCQRSRLVMRRRCWRLRRVGAWR
jgi:hypothetical protein